MNNSYSSDGARNARLLDTHSVRDKVEYIVELLSGFQLDLLCITET